MSLEVVLGDLEGKIFFIAATFEIIFVVIFVTNHLWKEKSHFSFFFFFFFHKNQQIQKMKLKQKTYNSALTIILCVLTGKTKNGKYKL